MHMSVVGWLVRDNISQIVGLLLDRDNFPAKACLGNGGRKSLRYFNIENSFRVEWITRHGFRKTSASTTTWNVSLSVLRARAPDSSTPACLSYNEATSLSIWRPSNTIHFQTSPLKRGMK